MYVKARVVTCPISHTFWGCKNGFGNVLVTRKNVRFDTCLTNVYEVPNTLVFWRSALVYCGKMWRVTFSEFIHGMLCLFVLKGVTSWCFFIGLPQFLMG